MINELIANLTIEPIKAAAVNEAIKPLAPHFTGLSTGRSGVTLHFTDSATAQEITAARAKALDHANVPLTADQEIGAASALTRDQIVKYIRQQMTAETPDTTATIKATVQAFIDTSPRMQRALANVAALYSYNTGTNAGYLQAALVLIGWMS